MEKLNTQLGETLDDAGEKEAKFGEILNLVDSADVTVFERLNASNDKAAKAEFLENPELVHPNNEYGNLNEDEVRGNFATLKEAEKMLDSSDLSDKRKLLIRLIVDDHKKKNEFFSVKYCL